jgi:hypothetical protein
MSWLPPSALFDAAIMAEGNEGANLREIRPTAIRTVGFALPAQCFNLDRQI